MHVLSAQNLSKRYPSFFLDNLSFSLEPGKITGFIGRNGAGKSTALNALFHFVHPDSGEVRFFGMELSGHETEIKQRVGFVSSGIQFYPLKKLKTISALTSSFYPGWDGRAYQKYLQMFQLDEGKTPSQLSAGMKVKYALALALSHNADLLILDEPTSGLDPVSRDDLLDVLLELCEEGKTILFSTHITSDLEKCADSILYLKNGRLIANTSVENFERSYKLLSFDTKEAPAAYLPFLLGCKRAKNGSTGLVLAEDLPKIGLPAQNADLESIMIHIERGVK